MVLIFRCYKLLVDEDYPDVTKIILVYDNLNTHNISSLYEAFPPSEAKRIADKIEIHHTPKHGSWLDIAEIELSVFTAQCLCRRMGSIEELRREAKSWYKARNEKQKGVDWHFTMKEARVKLKHLYPVII